MKKAMIMLVALFAFAAFAALPNAAYACGGDKAEKTSATKASASSCGEKAEKATATQASASSCGDKSTATQASATGCPATAAANAKMASGDAACNPANCDPSACMAKYEKVTMNISGMTCGGCEGSVKAALEKMDGVMSVQSVSHETGTAVVFVDPAKMKDKSLMTTAVANKGFNAEIIPAVATTGDATMVNGDGKTCSAADKAACAAACAAKKANATAASAKTAEGTK